MILRPRVSKLNVNIRKQLKFYCSWKSRDSNYLAIYSLEKAPNAQSNSLGILIQCLDFQLGQRRILNQSISMIDSLTWIPGHAV